DVLRPHLRNWSEVVAYFLRSVEADAAADGTQESAALLERLLSYKGVRAAMAESHASGSDGPVLPMHFLKGQPSLSLFTTIPTLGTHLDITLQDLRVESFFPLDEKTRGAFHKWAARAKGLSTKTN